MRLKHIKDADIIVNSSIYTVKDAEKYKGKWKELFQNNNDIEIEIGSGRGKFIINKALQNKNINYIGIEKYDSALVKAVKRLEEIDIKNLKLIVYDASSIENLFEKEINKIYLNFSDPWPKKRHAKRRLTSKVFLEKYDKLFTDKKVIEMKTDNDDLFDYSLISFEEYGYKIIDINRNHISDITTEYEDKFTKKGKNINYVKVERI
ncbi:MAG: tRNA (guanosine(46)-N7)-methyltransferase TrmB [Bacilli bacterium]|nr:tRNA (guanosine(46)-N7)-methyltransferase TrmB [Bacilli bacterium]